jgi:hypothetical protein
MRTWAGTPDGVPAFRPSIPKLTAGVTGRTRADVSDPENEWHHGWPESPEAPRSPLDAAWANLEHEPDPQIERDWREGE